MRKTIGFMVRTTEDAAVTVEGEEISTSGSMVSIVKTEEVSDLNPFPDKFIVRMYSVHNLLWIDPIYENDETTTPEDK